MALPTLTPLPAEILNGITAGCYPYDYMYMYPYDYMYMYPYESIN